MDAGLLQVLKIVVSSSIFFVWVVRYQNIVEEFKFFGYPNWLRDLVGILKLSFAVMILSENTFVLKVGSAGIASLMVCALITHVKISNPTQKMLPSFSLLCLSILFFIS
jgi:hypothetical protein